MGVTGGGLNTLPLLSTIQLAGLFGLRGSYVTVCVYTREGNPRRAKKEERKALLGKEKKKN